MKRSKVVSLVNEYMRALSSGDYSSVQFSQHVSFVGPLMNSPVEGREEVIDFLVGVSETVKDVNVQQYIIDGPTACVLIRYETLKGDVLPILDYIRIDEEGIAFIQPFFDPRPLIEGDD